MQRLSACFFEERLPLRVHRRVAQPEWQLLAPDGHVIHCGCSAFVAGECRVCVQVAIQGSAGYSFCDFLVSTQKVILRVINLSIADADNMCPFIAEIQAEVIIWNCTIFIAVFRHLQEIRKQIVRPSDVAALILFWRCAYLLI